ncbi:DUF5063 domain-containing protein [Pseudomonadota bacterium]
MRCQHEIIEAARSFCGLIEDLDEVSPVWLEEVSRLLPRLHAAVVELCNQTRGEGRHCAPCDLDARFEIFTRLRTMLGDKDPYWMEFDMAADGQVMSGSLADDLTDIFCELKRGLELLEGSPEEPRKALDAWSCGYKVHWGQHLIDAERHLYSLGTRNRF